MLRTCIGADGSTAKDFPNYAENKIRFENGNGDLSSNRLDRRHVGGGGGNHWGAGNGLNGGHNHSHSDMKQALTELLPEDIPGLPRHRPGEYSPRYYN